MSQGVGLCDEGDTARLWVGDTGIGIPEQALPHLCQRFHSGLIEAVPCDQGTRSSLQLPLG